MRQPRAYSVYYMGINIGGFFAPLVCGTVGELYGWHYGFTLAGFGMLTGLAVYLGGGRHLPPDPGKTAIRGAPGWPPPSARTCCVR